jgi:hypothetical protein
MPSPLSKKPSVKKTNGKVCGSDSWTIVSGALTRPPGAPSKTRSLFRAIGEKIPFQFLQQVRKKLEADDISTTGVYIAHDSMGYPRYIGRGNIFNRLEARRKAQVLELYYFSFFVVEHKVHEREIETIMIRAAGPLLDFNDRKIRNDIQAGDVRDFEAGTKYIERQYKKGKKVNNKVTGASC